MTDPALHLIVAAALAVLLASAGLHKLRDARRFAAQLAAYRLLPGPIVAPAGALLAATELGLALALLIPQARPLAALGSAALLVVYAMAMAVNLARGRDHIDCGCGDRPQPLSPWLVLRNGLLAGLALLLTLPSGERPLGWVDLTLGVPALLTLIIIYLTVEQLLENAHRERPRRPTGD